jgi:hypothetical protein
MIPITTLCIVMFAERQANILLAKPNVTGKKLKRESPVYHNTEFLKDKNVLLCTQLYKYAPNLESLLTQ